MSPMMLVFLILISFDTNHSTTPPDLYIPAETAFQAGEYGKAAKLLDQLAISNTVHGGEFYLNQGNAHLLAGNLGSAILAYRRVHAHGMESLATSNLAEARGRVSESVLSLYPPSTKWRQLRRIPGWFAWLAHGIACCAVCVSLWQGYATRALRWCMLLGWSVGAVWLAGVLHAEYDRRQAWFVVQSPQIALRQGNGMSYTVHVRMGKPISLSAGVEGRMLLRKPNGWILVELAEGQRGWIPEQSVAYVHAP